MSNVTARTMSLRDHREADALDAEYAETRARNIISCPRACGVDVRNHHSSDQVNGGCDTGPMSLEDMEAWFTLRGVTEPTKRAALIAEHYGKTETDLDEIYDAMHGPTA